MKSRGGAEEFEEKSRREKIREEKGSEERVRRKKMQVREKVGKSQNTAFFQWIVAPEGRKVGSLKNVRSQLAGWEIKNCTPLWCEAHLQVKKLKTTHVRTTFGSWDVEKVHAVVVRNAFRNQMYKSPQLRNTFKSCGVEKVHAVVARSTFRSQNVKNITCSRHFWTFRCRFAWQAQGIVDLVKSEQNVRFFLNLQRGIPRKCDRFEELQLEAC